MAPRIVILTGERGAGKTTVCQRAAAIAASKQYLCCGILTLRRSRDILDVLDVRSGQVRRLTGGSEQDTPLRLGPYRFSPSAFAWGNNVLAGALPCDLLVVDELGPLEFDRGQGWTAAFDVLATDGFAVAIVVVRPELLEQAQRRLAARGTTVFTVTPSNRDSLPAMIVGILKQM
jgi:nucleoside-triphosphatase